MKGYHKRRAPLIVAHRGYSSRYPENTLISFEKAIESGCDIVELDVQISADDEVVVFHDFTLERTTNGNGDLSAKTLAELKRLDAGAWFGTGFAGERIPTLREALEIAKGRVALFVEIKSRSGQESENINERLCLKISELLSKEGEGNELFLASFDWNCLKKMENLIPNVGRLLICFDVREIRRCADFVEGLAVFWKNVDRSLIQNAHGEGLWVCPWTVDDERAMRRFIDIGVDAIATNNPEALRRVIQNSS